METSNQDVELLRKLEEDLWREETRFDMQYMEQVLTDDFFEFGRSGKIYQRQDSLDVSPEPIIALLPLPEFRVRLIHSDVAQVTYKSVVTYDGIIQYANRSSIWLKTGAGWKLSFHQGTATTE